MTHRICVVPLVCALLAGLSVPWSAWASDGHGGAHGAEAGSRPAKVSGKVEKAAEPKVADKPLEKAADKVADPSGKTAAAPAKPDAASAAKPGVSMSELRDLIDQKISEVRAQQETAPVVKISPPARKASARKAPAKAVQPLSGDNSPQAAALAQAHRGDASGPEASWRYEGSTGPDNWAKLRPEFSLCGTGKRQSPIDIRDGIRVNLEPIQFDYRPTAFRVLDTGHTVQVNLEPGNSITVNGRRYELVQFHFHRPSEERINGRQFEMVAHLVHKDSEGRLAKIAVLMDQGKDHPMVQLVWNSLPLERHTEMASPVLIDMNLMLPEQKQYLTYMGSMTTPPCTEGVLWMVMKQPATLSRDQIAIFSRLYPMNARPIQPAAGRLIKDGQ